LAPLSVIVCCFNSVSRLSDTLAHLAEQDIHPSKWGLTLVDNASTDGTAAYARDQWVKLGNPVPIRIVTEEKPGLAEARRSGVLATDSPIIVFCDDDNWLAPDYLSRALKIMDADHTIGALGGRSLAVLEGGKTPAWFERAACDFAVGEQAPVTGDVTKRSFLWGAGLVVRAVPLREIMAAGVKALLSGRAGGKLMAGDDSEMCSWLLLRGYRLHYDSSLVFQHFISISRQTETYLESIQEGFAASHPILSAYQAYAHRRSHWFDARSLRLGALSALLRNEAKLLLRGHLVRTTVKKISALQVTPRNH